MRHFERIVAVPARAISAAKRLGFPALRRVLAIASGRPGHSSVGSDREEISERRAESLIALVEPHLPLHVRVVGPEDAWPLVGPGLLARQVGTLKAHYALRPLDQEADAFVLLRTLYEHAVTFAWIAAAPGTDWHQQFLKSDARARIEMDDDAREVGVPMLDAENRAEFERQVDQLPKEMPDLRQRGEAADKHWAGKIPALEASSETRSYRGLYAIAYRRQSHLIHVFVVDDLRKRFVANEVGIDKDGARRDATGNAKRSGKNSAEALAALARRRAAVADPRARSKRRAEVADLGRRPGAKPGLIQ
ncbi:MAG: DUF5677 domain-containing protein [Isosphaeraceae bacterium]